MFYNHETIGASSEGDTYSLLSQATTTMTIGDSLPAQLVRQSARKGFTFNIMSVGPPNLGKTALLSALFGKNLDMQKERCRSDSASMENLNPTVTIESKTFEIDDKKVRLRLTSVECQNYGEALCLKDTHRPVEEFIDHQLADYHKRESGIDRRTIKDKMIHCLFFFVSAIGHGLSKFDLEFLKAVHNKVNVVPIIARAEALTIPERLAFKRRITDDLKRNEINAYEMPDPDPEDSDDMKRCISEIHSAMPFAISTISKMSDNTPIERSLEFGSIDHYDRSHSDFLLLKTMLHMQMSDLSEKTHETIYENYRVRALHGRGK